MATATGKVVFEARGASHTLQFTTNRLCLLEDKLKSTILQIGGEVAFGLSITTMRAMFWAGLDQEDMTLAKVGDLIDDLGVSGARKIVVEAFDAAFPAPEAGGEASDDEDPTKAADG